MDVHTEQTYQKRIEELEAFVVSLKTQLAQRDAQLAQRDATIAALQQQVAELSKQVTESSGPGGPAFQELIEFFQATVQRYCQTTATACSSGRKTFRRRAERPSTS